MRMGQLSMNQAEREAFLADLHVGVLSVERPDGPPLATPIWYRYTPGGAVEFTIEAGGQKGRLLQAVGRATLCVQREQVPYAYVTVDGPVAIRPPSEAVTADIAERYLGEQGAAEYLASSQLDDEVLVQLTPAHWYTIDFAKLG